MCGISYQTYNNYENERYDPPIHRLYKIADVLECSPEWLIGEAKEDKCHLVQNDNIPHEEINAQKHNMTVREYNQLRYKSNPKKNFLTTIKSYKNILTALGFVITDPDKETLDKAIDDYLEKRTKRYRIF